MSLYTGHALVRNACEIKIWSFDMTGIPIVWSVFARAEKWSLGPIIRFPPTPQKWLANLTSSQGEPKIKSNYIALETNSLLLRVVLMPWAEFNHQISFGTFQYQFSGIYVQANSRGCRKCTFNFSCPCTWWCTWTSAWFLGLSSITELALSSHNFFGSSIEENKSDFNVNNLLHKQ